MARCGINETLVVQDRVPARPGMDYVWWRFAGDDTIPDASDWRLVDYRSRSAGKRNGFRDSDNSVLLVCCRRCDLPAIPVVAQPPFESPDDWVLLTDKKHVLRMDIDWIKDLNPLSGSSGEYEPVRGYAGRLASDRHVGSARCLRKHHPDYQAKPVEPPTFRIGDIVRFRGGMITFLVKWVAKDGMVRLADPLNPSYWCKPDVLEFVSRAEQVSAQ
jgi:hypothetical protein